MIIAHRLNTIDNADEIFFVNAGAVTEAGSMEHAVDMLLHGRDGELSAQRPAAMLQLGPREAGQRQARAPNLAAPTTSSGARLGEGDGAGGGLAGLGVERREIAAGCAPPTSAKSS